MPPKKVVEESKKEKKARLLREETELLRARKAVLDAANSNADHLSILPAFTTFKHAASNLEARIEFAASAQLDAATLDACFALLKRNMEQHYVASYGEWSDKAKYAELKHADARYLLVRDAATGALLGFCHVRFEWEQHDIVLYVMEIQLDESVRRRGLGKRLMQTLELIARKNALDAIWLTVLGSDADARRFYDKLGYSEVYSPDREVDGGGVDEGEHQNSYAVLAKSCKPAPPAHVHSAHCSHDHDHK
jgi:ribosomal protein S18 acetylase RimI-like enzyme